MNEKTRDSIRPSALFHIEFLGLPKGKPFESCQQPPACSPGAVAGSNLHDLVDDSIAQSLSMLPHDLGPTGDGALAILRMFSSALVKGTLKITK